jgi:hypothetical protein
MLDSHSWWKRSEPLITKTSGRAWVRDCRQASTLCTHSAANRGGEHAAARRGPTATDKCTVYA